MEYLDVSKICLGDDGFAAIASCVRNIEEMWIGNEADTNLTIKGISSLAQAILESDRPVSY